MGAALPWPAGAELGESAKLINRGPWVPPAEFSFVEQRNRVDTPEELARRQREGYRAKGGGLIGPLFKALLDRGVEIRTSTPATKLVVTALFDWLAQAMWRSRMDVRVS